VNYVEPLEAATTSRREVSPTTARRKKVGVPRDSDEELQKSMKWLHIPLFSFAGRAKRTKRTERTERTERTAQPNESSAEDPARIEFEAFSSLDRFLQPLDEIRFVLAACRAERCVT
jgi:hypothetical protein